MENAHSYIFLTFYDFITFIIDFVGVRFLL